MTCTPTPRHPRHANTWRPVGVTLPGAAASGLDLRTQFAMEAPLGRGGMGVVYRAQHRNSGLTVAVKVLRAGAADDARQQLAFRAEVEALAALDHPHVIAILDAGYLEAVPDEADPALAEAHGPCLVLEHASGGSLAGQVFCDWFGLREVAVAVLDALAHAHARGVIHRDLKPANLLRTTEVDLRVGLKVADFGIARLFDRGGVDGAVGTPAYMAPEQFEDSALTPATDLYALGCTLYALGCGAPPFVETDRAVLAALHRQAPPPPPRWRFAVPEGFTAWVLRLLAKRPQDRFGTAAAAALAFAELGEVPDAPLAAEGEHPDLLATPTCLTCLTEVTLAGPAVARLTASRLAVTRVDGPPAADAPPALSPIPADWRSLTPDTALVSVESRRVLRNLGLGLLAVRPTPIIGRAEERDLLWGALRTACAERRPVVVRLSGAADLGLGRLARWLGERAAELGVAVVGPPEVRTAVPRVAAVVGPASVLAHLRTIEAAAQAADGPQVIVVAMAASAWVRTPRHAARIAPLAAAPLGLEIAVRPLSQDDHGLAVRTMLGLAPETLAPLLRGTAGHPGWARLWLSAWLAEGRLRSSDVGFVLEGDPFTPPTAAVAPWRGLLDEALWFAGDRPDAERAAVADDPSALPADVDAMLRRLGLLEGTGADTTWAHPGVRHALMDRAQDGGRLAALQREVAEAIDAAHRPDAPIPPPNAPDLHALVGDLVPSPPTDAPTAAERASRLKRARQQGERWLAVGEPERALPWLRAALECQWPTRDVRSLCDVMRLAQAATDVPALAAEMEARAARLDKVFGLVRRARQRVEAVLALPSTTLTPLVRAHALLALAFTEAYDGQFMRGHDLAAEAVPLFAAFGPADEQVSALVTQMMCRQRAQVDPDVSDIYTQMEQALRRPDIDAVAVSLALWCLSRRHGNDGEQDQAGQQIVRAAILAAHASDDLALAMNCHNNLGLRLLRRGEAAESAEQFRQAIRLGELGGGGDVEAPRLNLAEALLRMASWSDAAQIFALLRSAMAQTRRSDDAFLCDIALLPCLVAGRDPETFARHLARSRLSWCKVGRADASEVLRYRDLAIECCDAQGDHAAAAAIAEALPRAELGAEDPRR